MSRLMPLCAAVLFLACAGPGPEPGPSSSNDALGVMAECSEDAQACVETCAADQGLDLDALFSCADEVAQCIEDNPDDPSPCEAVAQTCAEDFTSALGAADTCIEQCSDELSACAPEPGDLPEGSSPGDVAGAHECVEDGAACLSTCALEGETCVPSPICEDGAIEELTDCLASAQSLEEAQACVEAGLASCALPSEIDTECLSAAKDCAQICVSDVQACLPQ